MGFGWRVALAFLAVLAFSAFYIGMFGVQPPEKPGNGSRGNGAPPSQPSDGELPENGSHTPNGGDNLQMADSLVEAVASRLSL